MYKQFTAFSRPLLSLGRKGISGVVILLIFVVIAAFANKISPYPKDYMQFPLWQPPSLKHWLGTDSYGQDVLTQLIYGTRTSLMVGILAGLIATVVGVVVGVIAGFKQGWLGETLMRVVDLFLVIPTLVLALTLAAFIPSLGTGAVILIIGLLSWLYMARNIRSQTMAETSSAYVEVARVAGMRDLEIMFREILPNLVPILLAGFVLVTTQAVLTEATLSFLGVGNPTSVSWGSILSLAYANGAIMSGAWWWILPPGVAIALLCMSFILIGNGILDRFQHNRGNVLI